jgi:uncharacterized membrane protein HdeD (DUF308 family)
MPKTQLATPESWLRAEIEGLRKLWFLMLILGVALIVVGMVAISATWIAGLATVVVLGSLFLCGGAFEVINAFCARCWRGFGLHMLAGILYAVLGLLMVTWPGQAATVFTLMIAAGLFLGGLFRIVASIIGRFHGWGWSLLNGVITLVLGALIWREWPESAYWVIGLFVGIDMVFAGMSWVMTALTARTATAKAI